MRLRLPLGSQSEKETAAVKCPICSIGYHLLFLTPKAALCFLSVYEGYIQVDLKEGVDEHKGQKAL